MPFIFTLALQNLFHDRLRFIATVIGIVFSIVLVTVQMGLYLGFWRIVTTIIDHASADLWIMPRGTKCFEDLSLLDVKSHPTPTPFRPSISKWHRTVGFVLRHGVTRGWH